MAMNETDRSPEVAAAVATTEVVVVLAGRSNIAGQTWRNEAGSEKHREEHGRKHRVATWSIYPSGTVFHGMPW